MHFAQSSSKMVAISGTWDGATLSPEEARLIQALELRLRKAQQRLQEVQNDLARASSEAQGHRDAGHRLNDQHMRDARVAERLREERNKSVKCQQSLREQLQEVQNQLAVHASDCSPAYCVTQAQRDAVYAEIQAVKTHTAEVEQENFMLSRQHLQSNQANVCRTRNTHDNKCSTDARSLATSYCREAVPERGVVDPPLVEESDDTLSAELHTSSGTGGRSSAFEFHARAATTKLVQEVNLLDAQVQRERDRNSNLVQRLDTLRARGRQLDAGLQRAQAAGTERKTELQTELQNSTQRMHSLMDLAALTTGETTPRSARGVNCVGSGSIGPMSLSGKGLQAQLLPAC